LGFVSVKGLSYKLDTVTNKYPEKEYYLEFHELDEVMVGFAIALPTLHFTHATLATFYPCYAYFSNFID